MRLTRSTYASLLLFVAALLLVSSRAAAVEPVRPGPLHILEIDTDTADDQAEALTGALRSRVRSATGWQLIETTQSLSMLTAALRCPQRPDPACLQKIADQLKVDRFMWGIMTKNAAQHQVVAEVHLFARGKPDDMVREAYSDNVKDQNDDTLRKIAQRVFERLVGVATGTVNVDAGAAEGNVFVDGAPKGPLDKGRATVQIAAGNHLVEVRGAGAPLSQNVAVVAGASADIRLGPPAPVVEDVGPHTPAPVKKIAGWVLVGVGVVGLVAGAVEFAAWSKVKSANDDELRRTPQGTTCQAAGTCPDFDSNNAAAKSDSALGGVFVGAGAVALAVGVYLIVTDHPHTESSAGATTSRLHVLPAFGPHGGRVDLALAF